MSCDSSTEVKSKTPAWDGTQCVACPAEAPNWDASSGTCVAACPEERPYWTAFDNYFSECITC